MEMVFAYPGIGYLLFNAVSNEDYPLMQGVFLIIVVAVVLANFLVDILYVFIDPRVRSERRAS
jgi:peptide/nickel transport system permease protein